MQGISLEKIEAASRVVYEEMQPTPQYCWPLLCKRLGTEVWVKHENHTPIGAFKIRGGLVYFSHLAQSSENPKGVISATKGNHGQSITVAASRYGIPTTIVVPHGNSLEKNEAMRAQGAKLIEHGDDFQTAREFAINLASEKSLKMIPSFDPLLVTGVATYSLELLTAVKDLDVAYVPIGLGSGICGMLAVRNALKLKTQIVGVVSLKLLTAWLAGFPNRPRLNRYGTVLSGLLRSLITKLQMPYKHCMNVLTMFVKVQGLQHTRRRFRNRLK